MYHCHVGNDYVVLHTSESSGLLLKATGNAGEATTFNIRWDNGREDRKRFRRFYKLIVEELQRLKAEDPDAYRSYVFRSHSGPESVVTLFVLLDGHRRLARYVDCPEIERFTDISNHSGWMFDYKIPETVSIVLQSERGWTWRSLTELEPDQSLFRALLRQWAVPIGEYKIRVSDLEHVSGTVREFAVVTKHHKLKFSLDGLLVEPQVKPRKQSVYVVPKDRRE